MTPTAEQHMPSESSTLCCKGDCSAVPESVYMAMFRCLENTVGRETLTRPERTEAVVPILVKENWRFCHCYQDGSTPAHMLIYGLVRTEIANQMADAIMAHPDSDEILTRAASAAA